MLTCSETQDYSLNYTGVSFHRQSKYYEAYIYYQKNSSNGRKRSVGRYQLAADAALARDKCSDQLGITSRSNFADENAYNIARIKELTERGITVASNSKILECMSSNVNRAVSAVAENEDDDHSSKTNSEDESDFDNDLDSSHRRCVVQAQTYSFMFYFVSTHSLWIAFNFITSSQTKATSSHIQQETNQNYAANYTGVYSDKGKYKTYICHKKQIHIGSFVIAADAALARDKCLHQLGKVFTPNFASESGHHKARKTESEERGLEVSYHTVLKYISSRISKILSKISLEDKAKPHNRNTSKNSGTELRTESMEDEEMIDTSEFHENEGENERCVVAKERFKPSLPA